jgi:hypothetical protein
MAVRPDTVLKLSLAAGALMAGAGVGYYYAFFLPAQAIHETMANGERHDAAGVDRDTALERARAAEAQRQQATQQRYQSCVSSADLAYQGRWAAACRAQHARQQAAFEDCADDLFRTRDGCARDFPIEPERGCALPTTIGDRLAAARDGAKAQCLGELQGGL